MLSSLPGGATAFLASAQVLPFGIATTDPHGNVTFANAAYAQLAGCTPDELLGQSAGEFNWDALSHAAPSSHPWTVETACRRKNGESYTAKHTFTALRNPAGEATGFWIAKEEITDLKRPTGTPGQAEANLSALIESTEDLVASFDLEYRLLTLNKAFRKTIKAAVGLQAVVGMRPEEWLLPERYALWPPMFDRALSEGPFRTEYTLLDGRTLELSFNPILHDGKATGISVFGEDISERKRMQDAGRKSEGKFSTAFLYSPAIMALTDPKDGCLIDVNKAFERVTGYLREEAIGRTANQLGLWVDPVEFAESTKEFGDTGRLSNFERRFRTKAGAIRTGLTSAEPIELDGGIYVISATIDITERREAEARLQDQSRRFQRIIENADAGYFRIGVDGCYEDVNAAWLRMYGFASREEAIGLHFSAVQVPEDAAKAEEVAAAVLRGESIKGAEFSRLRRDGTVGYHGFSASPVLDGGRVIGIEGFLVDLSEQKEAARERRDTELRYRSLFDSMDEGVALHKLTRSGGVADNYILLDVNRRYENVLGIKREQVVKKVATIAYGTQDPPYLKEYAAAVESGSPFQFETYVPPLDKHFVVSVAPMGDDHFATIFFDITERKRAQQVIRQANEAVAKAEAHFHLMFNSVSDAVFVHRFGGGGLPGHYLEVNDSACRYLGYTREELLHMGPFDIDAPEEHSDVPVRAQRLRTDGCLMWDGTHIAKDGRRIPVEVNTRLVDLDGSPAIISSVRDISERKDAEKKYRDLFEGALEGIYRTSLEGRILAANPALAKVLGYDSAEEVVSAITDLAHQVWSDPEERTRLITLLKEHGSVRGFECQLNRKDGTVIWASVSGRMVIGGDGKTLCNEGFIEDISGRKGAESELLLSRQRLTLHVERTPLAVVEFDISGRVTSWNPGAVKTFGFSGEEVIGQPWTVVVPESARAGVDSVWESLVTQQGGSRSTNENITKEGRTIICEWFNTPLIDTNGTVIGVASLVLDITERKRAEENLRRLADIVESSDDAILSKTLEGIITSWNPGAERIYGYTKDEALGRSINLLVPPERAQELTDILERVKRGERVRHFEAERVRKDGVRIFLSLTVSPIKDGSGSIVGASTIGRDITERRRMETAFREAEAKFRAMFLNGPDALYLASLEQGKISDINQPFEALFGYSRSEAIGETSLHLGLYVNPADRARMVAELKAKGRVTDFEIEARRKNGELFPCSLAVVTMMLDGEPQIAGAIRDISERKRFDAEREKLLGQFAQAQKMESVGRLAGGVAHDFNNLLTVINGYSGFLLSALKVGDPLRSYAEEITTAGARAAGLTKQLLAFSRKQVIEPKVLDLNAIIRESTVMLRRLIGDDIVLETHLDGSLGQVTADPDQIHQVIMNLAVNARDAMPDGGALDIETLNVELEKEDGAAGHPDQIPGRYVLMTVTDTGHGMDETIREQIFEPFFTTKGVGKGTGLGLSTVYGIIRQNGGWIDVWSEVGVGTTFKIYLPRIDACPVAERKGISAPREGGGETILVVEDQEAVRSFAKAALRQHGYQVIQASDGDQAVSVAMQHSGQIHLLLTDVVMPGMNGRELSDRLKELRPNVKVLFISGYTADVIANRGVLDPGVAFLHKPFSQGELARKVREVLAAL
jgi:PAS domain S-box-containing protein